MSKIAAAANTAGKAANAAGTVAKSGKTAAKTVTPSYSHDATMPLVVGTIVVVGFGAAVGKTHKVNGKAILAGGVVALGLSAMDNINPRISAGFAAIMFFAACGMYLPDIATALGYANGGSGNDIDLTKATAKPSAASLETKDKASENKPALNTNGETPAGAQTPGNTATPPNSGGTIKT